MERGGRKPGTRATRLGHGVTAQTRIMLWSMHDINDFHDGGLNPGKPRQSSIQPSKPRSTRRPFSAASGTTASSITIRTATMQVVGHTMKEPAANAKVGKGTSNTSACRHAGGP